MEDVIIEVKNLTKKYGKYPVLHNITFSIFEGQITAILGPNGAGKSTLLNILCTDLSFDQGEIRIAGNKLGRENKFIRKNVGIVFQNGVLDERLTIGENLRVRGGFYGLKGKRLAENISKAADMTGIKNLLLWEYGKLSGGQKRRSDIARALIHAPHILFLDEPTSGLDPEMRRMVWQAIKRIREETGMTVVMTTHYMEEAAFADKIIVINKGSIAFQGTVMDIREKFAKDKLILYTGDKITELEISNTGDALKILAAINNNYEDFEVIKGSMENAYLNIIGETQIR
ncbi:MAG: ABC transporter ATP-binding protein [Bacillota bacterium]|nr:ABC transporter ATP-binding protein [Bacillota bacterium]